MNNCLLVQLNRKNKDFGYNCPIKFGHSKLLMQMLVNTSNSHISPPWIKKQIMDCCSGAVFSLTADALFWFWICFFSHFYFFKASSWKIIFEFSMKLHKNGESEKQPSWDSFYMLLLRIPRCIWPRFIPLWCAKRFFIISFPRAVNRFYRNVVALQSNYATKFSRFSFLYFLIWLPPQQE